MIRPYQPEDFPRMVQIAREAWKEIFAGFREQIGDELYHILYENKYQDKEYQLRETVTKAPAHCRICERNGKIVGFITFNYDDKRKIGIICNNAADRVCGEKGIGQEMYQAVLKIFRDNGMLAAMVSTGLDEGHRPARTAYQRAGFLLHHDSITYVMKL